jgi:putative ABC transport system substrate-binding protein
VSYFIDALLAVGYDGQRNVDLLYARADGGAALAAEATRLVDSNVDVIVAFVLDQILAAKRATSTIPIVMLYGAAPVELGLVASLAHPGGNVTGTAAVPLELSTKP